MLSMQLVWSNQLPAISKPSLSSCFQQDACMKTAQKWGVLWEMLHLEKRSRELVHAFVCFVISWQQEAGVLDPCCPWHRYIFIASSHMSWDINSPRCLRVYCGNKKVFLTEVGSDMRLKLDVVCVSTHMASLPFPVSPGCVSCVALWSCTLQPEGGSSERGRERRREPERCSHSAAHVALPFMSCSTFHSPVNSSDSD